METKGITTTIVLTISLFFGIEGASGARTQDQREAQTAIEEDLEREDIEGIWIESRDGILILGGRPRNVFVRDQALEIALEHVEAVESEMEIAAPENERELGKDIIEAVRRYSRLDVFDDVNAYVNEGKVALFGYVTEPYKSSDLENRMKDILGIQDFENKLEVLPASLADQELRLLLARRIYGDSMFEAYANMVHPPIRIIVKNSRVLLTGVVRGQLEKSKALSIVRSTFGVITVEDRLRTEN